MTRPAYFDKTQIRACTSDVPERRQHKQPHINTYMRSEPVLHAYCTDVPQVDNTGIIMNFFFLRELSDTCHVRTRNRRLRTNRNTTETTRLPRPPPEAATLAVLRPCITPAPTGNRILLWMWTTRANRSMWMKSTTKPRLGGQYWLWHLRFRL